MNEIVKYHNDFNKIKIPNLKELEQNLLMIILVSIKETKAGEKKIIDLETLQKAFMNDFKNNTEIGKYLLSLRDSFFKADFEILVKKENRVGVKYVNLFNDFALLYDEPDDEKPKKEWTNFVELELSVNPEFEYLINQLTSNFTRFELVEFIALSGKYTKTLYRLLKQFRSTGKARFEWEEFKRVMDIPENYQMCDIDKRILKPAIKELTKELNLFDYRYRMPFKNLEYTKEKAKTARGRGGKVIGITFTFKPENIELQKLENESKKIATPKQKYLNILINLKHNNARFYHKDKFWEFNDFTFDEVNQKFIIRAIELIRDEYENLERKKGMDFKAEDQEQFFKMIDTFRNGIR